MDISTFFDTALTITKPIDRCVQTPPNVFKDVTKLKPKTSNLQPKHQVSSLQRRGFRRAIQIMGQELLTGFNLDAQRMPTTPIFSSGLHGCAFAMTDFSFGRKTGNSLAHKFTALL